MDSENWIDNQLHATVDDQSTGPNIRSTRRSLFPDTQLKRSANQQAFDLHRESTHSGRLPPTNDEEPTPPSTQESDEFEQQSSSSQSPFPDSPEKRRRREFFVNERMQKQQTVRLEQTNNILKRMADLTGRPFRSLFYVMGQKLESYTMVNQKRYSNIYQHYATMLAALINPGSPEDIMASTQSSNQNSMERIASTEFANIVMFYKQTSHVAVS